MKNLFSQNKLNTLLVVIVVILGVVVSIIATQRSSSETQNLVLEKTNNVIDSNQNNTDEVKEVVIEESSDLKEEIRKSEFRIINALKDTGDEIDNEKVIEETTKAIDENEEDSLAYASRAGAKINTGDYMGAIEDADESLSIDNENPLAILNKATAYEKLTSFDGKYHDMAYNEFSKFIELFPDHPSIVQAHSGRAMLWNMSLSSPEEMISDWSIVLSAEPENFTAYHQRALLYNDYLFDYENARLDFQNAIKFDKNLETNAIQHLKYMEQKIILENAQDQIDKDPSNYEAYVARGKAFQDTSQFIASINELDKAIEVNPIRIEAYCERCLARMKSGSNNYQEARKDCNIAIELEPENYLVWIYSARFHEISASFNNDTGTIERAKRDYNKAIELNPENEFAKERLEILNQ